MHTRADRNLRGVVAKRLETQQLTIMEWLALGAVSEGSKTGLSMSEIASKLSVTLPQVTALVTGLSDRKLTKQKVLASDHRSRQVSATLKGKRLLSKLETAVSKDVRLLTKDIPEDYLRSYKLVIQQLSEQKD